MSINLQKAEQHPELAKALIMAIFPLQDYLLTPLRRNNMNELWGFKIGELKQQLKALTEKMDGQE